MDGVSILFDPLVLKRLIFEGLWMSVRISAISIAISLVLGTFLGVAMCKTAFQIKVNLRLKSKWVKNGDFSL